MSPKNPSRRDFLAASAVGAIGAGLSAAQTSPAAETAASPSGGRRVGAVAYCMQYSIGLFRYQDRPGKRMDATQFVDVVHQTGGRVAQLYHAMIDKFDDPALAALRRHAAQHDVALEVHGGLALAPSFERTLHQAAALGTKVVGCSFGFLSRPNQIATLAAWDAHLEKCRDRLRTLADTARALDVIVAVENHLDFTIEELRDLVLSAHSPHVGVLLDVGNSVGTLDDPTEAAELLGPLTAATHYKDFAVEEVVRGFRFTMVPLGCGSLRLEELTAALFKHLRPEANLCVEMLNGQQFEVCWLEDRFWVPFRGKTARQLAATLRHVRSQAIDIAAVVPDDELAKMPYHEHVEFEKQRLAQCISSLKKLRDGAASCAVTKRL